MKTIWDRTCRIFIPLLSKWQCGHFYSYSNLCISFCHSVQKKIYLVFNGNQTKGIEHPTFLFVWDLVTSWYPVLAQCDTYIVSTHSYPCFFSYSHPANSWICFLAKLPSFLSFFVILFSLLLSEMQSKITSLHQHWVSPNLVPGKIVLHNSLPGPLWSSRD